jgi:hypothetical protein
MINLRLNCKDTKTPLEWRVWAKGTGRRFGPVQAATNYASTHGSAAIHNADDSATIFWREGGFGYLRVKRKQYQAKQIEWIK